MKKEIIEALTMKRPGNERMALLLGLMDRSDNPRGTGAIIDKLARVHLTPWQLSFFPVDFYSWYID